MKVDVVRVVTGAPTASFVPRRTHRPTVKCFSPASGHLSFIKDVAMANPPEHLDNLLKVLQTKGAVGYTFTFEFPLNVDKVILFWGSGSSQLSIKDDLIRCGENIVSPGSKAGLIPLSIPLSENQSGAITALLRWPTAPAGMELPVVEVRKHGVWLLAKNVDQFLHRILVEEDAISSDDSGAVLYGASLEAGQKLYERGDFIKSKLANLDTYILKKVGLFPDVLERKVMRHFETGDQIAAMITGEFYTKKDLFPGFGRPFVFNAEIMMRVGRSSEAKDSARVALKSPWWTLGCPYEEAAKLAQWEDEQIEYIKERVTEEGRQEDLKKGKAPAQVALDEAAFLLDLASVDGMWTDYLDQIADCYKEAGLDEMARFILYTD